MAGKGSILEYRTKLDSTLVSRELLDDEMVHTLVKNQMLQSPEDYTEYVVERRTEDVTNFLSMLRSASAQEVDKAKSSNERGWKIKQDTDEFRVMYQEGPKGTPFHTLLVEGYVDGPVDVCLCISWESDLYKKWWPQTTIPAFKILSSHCVKNIRAGEQISLVRMKVAWPLSSREALVHYFTFEYFQDGLVVVLLNTISDVDNVDRSTHGFTRDGIPDAEDVVRIDVVGGFAVQKVGPQRCYFRTIANMDIKVDFVPPAFINFVSRQLIGSGFRLYKKEVASVTKGDVDFFEALKDPYYSRIRQALYSLDTPTASLAPEKPKSAPNTVEEESIETADNDSTDKNTECNGPVTDSKPKYGDMEFQNEIVESKENGTVEIGALDEHEEKSHEMSCSEIEEVTPDVEFVSTEAEEAPKATDETKIQLVSEVSSKVGDISPVVRGDISPVVREALGTLEKVIAILREYNNNPGNNEPYAREDHLVNFGDSVKESSLSKADQVKQKNGTCREPSKIESSDLTSLEPENMSRSQSSSFEDSKSSAREANQSNIAPATPNETFSFQSHIRHLTAHASSSPKIVSKRISINTSPKSDAKNASRNTKKIGTKKKRRWSFFCFASEV